MKAVWIDARKLRGSEISWSGKCVVCGNSCERMVAIKAIPTDVTTGGIRFFLGFSRKFLVPMHSGDVGCEKKVRKSLRRTELYPLLGFVFCSIFVFVLAATINTALIFLVFVLLFLYFGVSYFIERKVEHSIRITESPATGDFGAYGFEFSDHE
ncbi:MAG TPA: hypothetical protein VF268_00800, partial [Gammaproteobacteria bacterium]